jgi:hypothetical protein
MKNLITLIILTLNINAVADSLNISNIGVTYHSTLASDLSASKYMKNKLTNDGAFVRHNEMNVTLIKDSGYIVNGTVLSDCFNNIAYHVSAGKQWALNDDKSLSLMLTGGLYVRPTVKQLKMTIGFQKNGMDLIPIGWVGLKKNFKIDDNLNLSIQSNTNLILTHTTIGFEFGF